MDAQDKQDLAAIRRCKVFAASIQGEIKMRLAATGIPRDAYYDLLQASNLLRRAMVSLEEGILHDRVDSDLCLLLPGHGLPGDAEGCQREQVAEACEVPEQAGANHAPYSMCAVVGI